MFTYEAVDYSDDPYLQEVARYSVSQEDAAYIVKQRREDCGKHSSRSERRSLKKTSCRNC